MKKSVYAVMSVIAVVLISAGVHTSHAGTKPGYSALAMDPSATRIFAFNEGQKGIDVLDSKTRTVANTILRDKVIAAIAVDGRRRIVAAVGENKLYIVSIDTYKTLKDVNITGDPTSIALDPRHLGTLCPGCLFY